jgi:catechol 2,3-dioxygenase-like lactoylglutathione lyase family enzyme
MDADDIPSPSRRDLLLAAASAPVIAGAWSAAVAAEPKGDELPLITTGLEHFAMTVPDVTKCATFYCSVFGHGLFKEDKPPLRYYVMTGKAYIAIGHRDDLPRPVMDHYCVTVEGYDRDKMNAAITAAGMTPGGRGLVMDPDRIGLQLLKDPAGLTDTNIPADRILGRGYGLVQPYGMDHVLLRVADLGRSSQFYDRFFARTRAGQSGEIWYRADDTTIRLAKAMDGNTGFKRVGIRVGPYDAAKVGAGLTALGARVGAGASNSRLRFTDPDGFEVELIKV